MTLKNVNWRDRTVCSLPTSFSFSCFLFLLLFLIPQNASFKTSEVTEVTETDEDQVSTETLSSTLLEEEEDNAIQTTASSDIITTVKLLTFNLKNLKRKKRPSINDTCIVSMSEVMRNKTGLGVLENETIYADPCNLPSLRAFMHCNTAKMVCECYRDWDAYHGTDIPNYKDPEIWKGNKRNEENKTLEPWFVYEHTAAECLVRGNKRCGKRSEQLSPYRCEGEGRCITVAEDKLTYLCSKSKAVQLRTASFMLSLILAHQIHRFKT